MKIWATLGPSSYDKILELEHAGVDMFRLNLSHVDSLSMRIKQIQDLTDLPICVDTDCGKYMNEGLNKDIDSYCLRDYDIVDIELARTMEVKNVALSFANIKDVKYIRAAFPEMFLISKIEHLKGLEEIEQINNWSGALLIDRGDLSRSIEKKKIPDIQKKILKRYPSVYVATDLMDSMMNGASEPTNGEVNDIWNILCDGASGLVLAGEIAIGEHPVEAVKEVKKIIDEFELKNV